MSIAIPLIRRTLYAMDEDIRIVGIDEDMTVESPVNRGLLYVFLRLSRTPPPLWQTYFTETRKIARHPRWRRAWVDRRFIVVECIPEEIEKYHLADLRQDIATVNQRYADYVRQHAGSEHDHHQAAAMDRERVRNLKNRLSFD
jgi:hypothetical protein